MTTVLTPENEWHTVKVEIDQWAKEILTGYTPTVIRAPKVIRDAVHGFLYLQPHEIALTDTPFLQRLHYIHQTALAYLVYPSMNHSRFEHSLGVAVMADHMIRSLQSKHPKDITSRDIQTVRLAALLHDVGHTIFSHLGEGLFDSLFGSKFDRIKAATVDSIPLFFANANSGEILSYAVATSQPMRDLLNDQFAQYRKLGCELESSDLEVAAGLIIGRVRDPSSSQYLTDIINGPIDADKLDYIRRDCHFSGIRADIDPQRIINGLDWISWPGFIRYLTTDASVVPQLEQILLAKTMLFTSVYHHHKVRTLECMIKAMFHTLINQRTSLAKTALRFATIADFLNINDYQFLTWGAEESCIKDQMRALLDRRLLKRVLVINPHSVTRASKPKLTSLRSRIPGEGSLIAVRTRIFAQIPDSHKTRLEHFWLDFPKPPDVDEEALHCWVSFGSSEPQALSDLFPSNDWVETYVANKLNYYVFYDSDEGHRHQAAEATRQYLQEVHQIETTPRALELAHIS